MLCRANTVLKEEIVVQQNLKLSHAGTVWDGALVLSADLQKQYLQKKEESVVEELIVGKNIVELGSGTGILGLSLVPFKPASVIMTDLPEYVEFLNQNIQKNKQLITKYFPTKQEKIKGCALTWGNLADHQKYFQQKQGEEQQERNMIDTIIASEVAYSQLCITDLLETLVWFKNKHNKNIKMLFSYQKYSGKQRNFLTRLLDFEGSSKFIVQNHAKQQQNSETNIFIEDVSQQEMDQQCRDDYYGILILR